MEDMEQIQEVIYHCHICMDAFVCEETFTQHMNNHTTERPFECKECTVRFISEEHLDKHLAQKHVKAEYESCLVCGKQFHDQINLKSHMAVHSEERPFVCHVCKKSFKRKGELENHSLLHSGLKRFKCTFCKKSFSQKYSLIMHIRGHTGEKPFKCMKCGKDFNRIASVRIHMRTHNNDKRYQCTKCDETFKLLRDRKRHMVKVHAKTDGKISFRNVMKKSSKKPTLQQKKERKPTPKITPENKGKYECILCNQEFEHVTEFNDHIKTHDVDTCYLCGQKLKNKIEKRSHVTRPVTVNLSKCFTCGLKFKRLQEFKEHMTGHSELCRLEECLKNAEGLHRMSKRFLNSSQDNNSSEINSNEEKALWETLEDMEESCAVDNISLNDAHESSMQEDEHNSGSDLTAEGRLTDTSKTPMKEEQDFNYEDDNPYTAILEIEAYSDHVNGHHKVRTSKVTTSSGSCDTLIIANANKEDLEKARKKKSHYKVASVSPPRTRGSVKIRKDLVSDKVAVVRRIEWESAKKKKGALKIVKGTDDCDLAESYSVYVKNILRLQPVEKQMALIKSINTAIAKYITD